MRTINTSRLHPARAGRAAFTLVELMVVIFIIAIVIAMVVSVSKYVREESARKQTEATQALVMSAVDAFYTAFDKYPADNQTDPSRNTAGHDTTPDPQSIEKSVQTLMVYLTGSWNGTPGLQADDYTYLVNNSAPDTIALKAKIQALTSDKLLQLPKDAYDPTASALTIHDGYGQPMRYEQKGGLGGRPVLISAGPDEKFNTDDDIRSDGR